jgi:oligoribonuclease
MIQKNKNNLVWIDMEFTGLDPRIHVVLEIACIITDSYLNIQKQGPDIAIHYGADILGKMDEWNKTHHFRSGLLEKVKKSGETNESAENKMLTFISTYCERKTALMCGNSIYQDRYFLKIHMPRIDAFLHYRNIDVSTVKELCHRWFPGIPRFAKKKHHRALDDIRESIAELEYYKNTIFHIKGENGIFQHSD